jgi:gamma-glutamyltranspeptidase/glutathione hydrolase
VRKDTSRRLWDHIRTTGWTPLIEDYKRKMMAAAAPQHSDAVVAVDSEGNIAAVCHTINAITWGTTGIFVDGISIPDSASFQQPLLAAIGPGARVPDPTTPGLAIREGRPALAFSSIGGGLNEKTLQVLTNIIDFGMSPKEAIDAPSYMGPPNLSGDPTQVSEYEKMTVGEGDFDPEVLAGVERLGQPIKLLTPIQQGLQLGYVIAIQIDPKTGLLLGATSPKLNGAATGY